MTTAVRNANSRRFRIASLAVFVLVALSPFTARAQFLHPKITRNETTIRNVVIMPAKVEVMRDSMKGPEGMAAESELMSVRIAQVVTEALKAKHIGTLASVAVPSSSDAAQKYSIADIQTRYDDLLPKIMKKRKDVKKGRFTMGDEVLNLNLDKSADAIVFIRGQGHKLSSGKKVFGLFVPVPDEFMSLSIGIIDARTGEVLLYTDPAAKGDPTRLGNTRLWKAIQKSLKKLPAVP